MFCFVLGDVGSSLAQAFLPPYAVGAAAPAAATAGPGASAAAAPVAATNARFNLDAARPAILQILRVSWTISAVCVAISSAIVLGEVGGRGWCGARSTKRSYTTARRGISQECLTVQRAA